MAKLMTPAVRKVLYTAKMTSDLNEALNNIVMPPSPANAISEVRNQMNATLADLKSFGNDKFEAATGWSSIVNKDKNSKGCSGVRQKFDRSLLHFSRAIGTVQSRLTKLSKANFNSSKDINEALKNAAINTAKQFASKEIQRIQSDYRKQVNSYRRVISAIKSNYQSNGSGRKEIDYRCDCIDRKYDECITLGKNIPKHIAKMTAQAPVPGAVGTCTTNPAYAIITLLINICVVLNMLIRMIKLMEEIQDDIKYFFPFFDITQLNGLSSLMSKIKEMLKGVNDSAENSINDQKNSLTPVYSLKYNKTTMKWEEDTLNGKIRGYKRPSKVKVSREDFDGESVITDAEIETYEIFTDALATDSLGESVDGLIYEDGSIKAEAKASVSVTADGKHSIIHLSNGRTITIDRIVNIGDLVKLNDGTIITIGD